VGYAGLGAKDHDRGQSHWTGGITKSGRRDLRRAILDAAGHGVKRNGHWNEKFQKLDKRIGRPKALVVIARKLLIVV
jgi:transposase